MPVIAAAPITGWGYFSLSGLQNCFQKEGAAAASGVQIRSVVMIALLAICRKVIILDLNETDALHILALAAAILALGVVYWLVRDSDQRISAASGHNTASPVGDVNR
jgi:hypothetical protein